jgi:hypothetical protein
VVRGHWNFQRNERKDYFSHARISIKGVPPIISTEDFQKTHPQRSRNRASVENSTQVIEKLVRGIVII